MSATPSIYAPPEPDPDSAFRFSDHVLTGKVVSSEVIPNTNEDTAQKKYRDTVVYEIQVHEWHKNPLNNNTITVYGKHYPNDVVPEPMWGVVEFEIGSTVYLYLDNTEDGLKFREHASYLVKDSVRIANKKIIPPPLKQMELGIKLGHVICDKDKNIVWNIHFKPACVYPESENILIKRGWAKLRLMMPASADPIRELEITGQNEFTLRILGNLIVEDDKHPFSYEKKRALAWEHSQRHYPDQKYLEYAIEPHMPDTPEKQQIAKEIELAKKELGIGKYKKPAIGGCLIATATYGSELAPQVQKLREIRDSKLLNTNSGSGFMESFNDFYYSFSPYIADYERENPIFKEMIKIGITPMITTLSLMDHAETESEVLGIGISLIVLNIGMYAGIPIIGIICIRKRI